MKRPPLYRPFGQTMTPVALIVLGLLTVTLSLAAPGHAQEKSQEIKAKKPPTVAPLQLEPRDDFLDIRNYSNLQRRRMLPPAQISRLQVARSLIKTGDYRGAADLLELVYREYPLDPRVVSLLRDCYLRLKRYYSAIEILKRVVEADLLNISAPLDLAEVYFKAGKKDSALIQIDFALGIPANTRDLSYYDHGIRRALHLLLDNWQDSLVLEYSAWLREGASDDALHGDLVAEALERQKNYAGATLECLKYMQSDTTRAGTRRRAADKKLAQLLSYEEALDEVEKTLKQLSRDNPLDTLPLKYLGELYLKNNRLETAFVLYAHYDSLVSDDGRRMAHYMRECYDRRFFAKVTEAGQYLLQRHPDSPVKTMTEFYLAKSYLEVENPQQALEIYQRILSSSPSLSDKTEAAVSMGDIYLKRLDDPLRARVLFEEAEKEYHSGMFVWRARFALVELEIIDGQLQKARGRLLGILRSGLPEDLAEQGEYHLARLDLYEGKLDSADIGFKRLIQKHPRGFYVNDVLNSIMVLQQGAEGDAELLTLYSRSELFRAQRQLDSLTLTLISIVDHADTTLADVALLDLGRIYLAQKDTTRSLERLNQVSERFPESYFAPHASKLKADIYFQNPDRRVQALAIYRSLLKRFGSYPFAVDIRQKLREAGEDPPEDSKRPKPPSEA